MEAEGEADTLVAEVGGQVGIHRAQRAHHRQRFQHVRPNQVAHAVERRLQHRAESRQLLAVVGHEARQGGGILRRELGHLRHHPRQVRRRLDVAARLEDQVVLRIEPYQVDLARHLPAACLEDVVQHAGVEKEGGPHVEAEPARCGIGLDGGRPAAHLLRPLEHRHVRARPCQKHGRCQAARAGTDDGDPTAQRCTLRGAVTGV